MRWKLGKLSPAGNEPGCGKGGNHEDPDNTKDGALHRLPFLFSCVRQACAQESLLGYRRDTDSLVGRIVDRFRGADVPRLRSGPLCRACPTGAYSQRKDGGVIVRKNLCIRCGRVRQGLSRGCHLSRCGTEPFVCIHCGRCVPFCPHDCLEMADAPGERSTGAGGAS